MCNLYRQMKSAGEVARWFDAIDASGGSNLSSEIYPGHPGLVLADGEARCMIWGFPLKQTSKRTGKPLKPKPVNNARSDKLSSYTWRYAFEERRCLIPLTGWAEAQGLKGQKTRTWLGLADQDLLAAAGIWGHSDEWGDWYSMVMVDAAPSMADIHSRMPVLVQPSDWQAWLTAPAADAFQLCQPFDGPLAIDRTDQPWISR